MSKPAALMHVARASARRADSETRYIEAVRQAHKVGVPITHIAKAAGVSRPTLYKMLRDQ